MEKTRKFFAKQTYEGLPVPSYKQSNKDHFGQNGEDQLVEWEKNQVNEVFIKYHTEFTGNVLNNEKPPKLVPKVMKGVLKEDLMEIMKALMTDECIIGKLPNLQPEEANSTLFDAWEITEEKKMTWAEYRDEVLNSWSWKMQDRDELQ